jgi:hypothetical protein
MVLHRPVELVRLNGEVRFERQQLEGANVLRFHYNCRLGEIQIFRAIVPNHYKIRTLAPVGPVAQRLEQRTHNPLVLGSNPSGPTNAKKAK